MTCMTVKNIANYEMNFDPNEMLERFVRADQSRTAEGSGLGLSIAKEILAQHKDDIRIESVYGEGTTVTILMPRAID